jgi:VanZ family protein
MRLISYGIQLYKLFISNRKKYLYIPLGLYWLLILTLTSIPGTHVPKLFGTSDKIKHVGAYLGLAFLLTFALYLQKKYIIISKYFYLFALLFTTIYGLFDEIHQIFIPGRSFDWWDLVADIVGSIAGIWIAKIIIGFNKSNDINSVELS